MDSGMGLPWDSTTEVSKFVIKYYRVSIAGHLALEEKLQIVDSNGSIVSSLEDKYHQDDINDGCIMSIVYI
jgi:hypothetical protein